MCLTRIAGEGSFKLLYLGCTGPGATHNDFYLHASKFLLVISFMTLNYTFYIYLGCAINVQTLLTISCVSSWKLLDHVHVEAKSFTETSRYRACLNHLATKPEDTSIKSTDKQRLKGYLLKWS